MLKDLLPKYKRIIVVNEISYVGDSILFFWPMVNGLISAATDKEVSVFHPHSNLFKPESKTVYNGSLIEFYEDIEADDNTLVIAFIKSGGQLKEHLKLYRFQSIVKGMVGLDFVRLNLPEICVSSREFERIKIDAAEIKYLHTNRERHNLSGFPLLKQIFNNVYEYAKICNESFLGLKENLGRCTILPAASLMIC